jgi:hypothetical protein
MQACRKDTIEPPEEGLEKVRLSVPKRPQEENSQLPQPLLQLFAMLAASHRLLSVPGCNSCGQAALRPVPFGINLAPDEEMALPSSRQRATGGRPVLEGTGCSAVAVGWQ